MLGLNKKLKEDDFFDTDDRLIVWDQETLSCEIYQVTEITDESVVAAGRCVVPKHLCNVATSREGRVFMYQAPAAMIGHAAALAKLEQSTVLKQITNYKPEPPANPNLDIRFFVLALLLFVAIIAAAF